MDERPILFSAPMVRAILGGRKTQTRRLVKPQPQVYGADDAWGLTFRDKCGGGSDWLTKYCQYGQPGDRLWVREKFLVETSGSCRYDAEGLSPGEYPDWLQRASIVHYAATTDLTSLGNWKPSIHMPRWASRITLEIRSVRVERLHEISVNDVRAEGVGPQDEPFVYLWDSINGKKPGASWESNPWVWVIEFKKIEESDND